MREQPPTTDIRGVYGLVFENNVLNSAFIHFSYVKINKVRKLHDVPTTDQQNKKQTLKLENANIGSAPASPPPPENAHQPYTAGKQEEKERERATVCM